MDLLKHDDLLFFDLLQEGFRRASATTEIRRVHFQIAGRVVQVEFAGARFESCLAPPLRHLQVDGGKPDLTIRVWDAAASATPLPLLVRNLVDSFHHQWWDWLDTRKEIKGLHGTRVLTTFHLGPSILSAFCPEQQTALYWIPDVSGIPYWEKGSPFLAILSWWLASRGCQVVHGAALANSEGAVLLPGRGGSGKSTTTLSCLDTGLGILGDDYCVVEASENPAVHSLYSVAKLKTGDDLQAFPALRDSVMNPVRQDGEKVLVDLAATHRRQLISTAALRGILLPRISGRPDSRIISAERGAALRHLAPSTLFQLAGSGSSALHSMASLVRSVPVAQLELGTDRDQIPGLISQFLESLEPINA